VNTSPFLRPCALALCLAASLAAGSAAAQTTDGYHSIQVFPVVVDTASFAQRFSFRNPNAVAVTIKPRYYPAEGLPGAGTVVVCQDVAIAAGKTATYSSLRTLCPSMPAGSQFGFLYTSETLLTNTLPYAGFSRVANPQGNGFSVEAFPAHTFTSADSVVNGIRRLAAAGGSPSFQTNCFVANLNDVTPAGSPVSTPVQYTIYDSATNVIGGGTVNLLPGRVVRLFDVFATGGAPAGDHNDAQIKFEELGVDEPALMSACTVQDNTSLGADFRIAKQEVGAGGQAFPGDTIGSQDNHVARKSLTNTDSLGRTFTIAAGANGNTHVMYFRHPDYVQCELVDPGTNVRALPGLGLEIRMLGPDGLVVAGGNGETGWNDVYLGDKTDRNSGSNTRYRIEVEDSETNTGVARSYKLHCQSGSGHTLGDLIRYQAAGGSF
jgi:hypothetical protein